MSAAGYWASLIAALYDTGYRLRSVLLSKWSDLDVERRVLRRPAEDQKQGADQAQPIHPDTIEMICKIKAPTRADLAHALRAYLVLQAREKTFLGGRRALDRWARDPCALVVPMRPIWPPRRA